MSFLLPIYHQPHSPHIQTLLPPFPPPRLHPPDHPPSPLPPPPVILGTRPPSISVQQQAPVRGHPHDLVPGSRVPLFFRGAGVPLLSSSVEAVGRVRR